MKKEFLIVATAVLCACGGSNTNQEQRSDTLGKELPEDTVVVVKEMTPFTSPDRQFMDVRGNVSKLSVQVSNCDSTWSGKLERVEWMDKTYTFDQKGVVAFDPKEKIRLSRNDSGQITKKEVYVADLGIYISEEYLYNEQGMLDTMIINGLECHGKKYFTYDNDLECVSSVEPSMGEGEYLYTDAMEYFNIVERDSLGNWTKRRVTTVNKYSQDGKNIEKEEREYRIETREIFYY
ncbi:MAG: hypothetical protein IKX43_04880 [Paludibacteraceae bacterium]|nr:hypothetical protein [Paludibacteraceae bacterium]